jgi:hypothetical protein
MSINKKLLEFQKKMPRIDKDAQNDFFKKNGMGAKYATLAGVLKIVLPLLNEQGILFSSEQKYIDNVGWIILVELIDIEDDTKKTTILPLLNTTDMQKMGSCITYAQRYGLLPLLGIAPELDDDGNNAADNNAANIIKIDFEKERIKLCMELDKLLIEELPNDEKIEKIKSGRDKSYEGWNNTQLKAAIIYVKSKK